MSENTRALSKQQLINHFTNIADKLSHSSIELSAYNTIIGLLNLHTVEVTLELLDKYAVNVEQEVIRHQRAANFEMVRECKRILEVYTVSYEVIEQANNRLDQYYPLSERNMVGLQ